MRLSRRSFLLGGGTVGALTLAGTAWAQRPPVFPKPTSIPIQATSIDHFSVADPDRVRFGELAFRSGLHLRSSAREFGGFSGLWRSADGGELVALSDNAQWLRARVATADGRMAGLAAPVLSPLAFANGKLLRASRYYDTESLAISGTTAFIGIERHHAVMRFSWNGEVLSGGDLIRIPDETRSLPGNAGLEALAVAPPGSALAGAVLAVAERSSPGEDAPTRGYILTGPARGTFAVSRSDGFDISDMAFLPSGDLVLLERRFSLFAGFATRLRRVPADTVRAGRRLDGAVIFQSDGSQQIDNMEGLSVHREGADTVLTMISDDNFNGFQRTLLLEFALVG